MSESQRRRIAAAYREAGAEAVEGYRKVILGMINDGDRRKLLERTVTVTANRIALNRS